MPKPLPQSPKPLTVIYENDAFDNNEHFAEDAPRLHWIWLFLGVAVAIGIFALGAFSTGRADKPNFSIAANGTGSIPSPEALVVHVAGQVNKPGVYEFAFDARVRDAIQKAGGTAKNADLNSINLAAYLEDGQKIEVAPKPSTPGAIAAAPAAEYVAPLSEYSQPEPGAQSLATLPDFSSTKTKSQTGIITEKPKPEKADKRKNNQPRKERVLPNVPRANTPDGNESQNADPTFLTKNPINLNSATQEQLELLPGIGPAMAAKILAARKEKGGFNSIEELDKIPGIGEKKMEKLRPLVTVS